MRSSQPEAPRMLLVLTLAMEQAAREQAWEQFHALIREREAIIERLSRANLDTDLLAKIRAADLRTIQALLSEQASMAEEYRASADGAKARRAYRAPSGERAVVQA